MISWFVYNSIYYFLFREIVSEDIDDFEYTPLPKYPGESSRALSLALF